MKNRIPAPFLRASAAALCVFAGVAASAETVNVYLKKPDRTPLPGHTVTFYLSAAPFTVLDTKTTDSAGSVTFTDNVFSGQGRCIKIASQSGWVFSSTWSSDEPPYRDLGTNPSCSTLFPPEQFFWGTRAIIDHLFVIGGAKGYVNPALNEVASIVVFPFVADTVTVKIYTSRGKLVATKTKIVFPRLQNEIEWDGRNADGQIVSSGIYIAHISGAGINSTRKIAVVRN